MREVCDLLNPCSVVFVLVFFGTKPVNWLGRTSPKYILCQSGARRITFTPSIKLGCVTVYVCIQVHSDGLVGGGGQYQVLQQFNAAHCN